MDDTSYARINLQPRQHDSEHQPLLDKPPASVGRLFVVSGWYMIASFQLCGSYFAMTMFHETSNVIFWESIAGLSAWPAVAAMGYRQTQKGPKYPERPVPSSPPSSAETEWLRAFRRSATHLVVCLVWTVLWVLMTFMLVWGEHWNWERGGHAGLVFAKVTATVDMVLGIGISGLAGAVGAKDVRE